ncbi:MAG: hypothetical protein ABI134_31735, partial [Byssovorax sp.]
RTTRTTRTEKKPTDRLQMSWFSRGLAPAISLATLVATDHARAACVPVQITTEPEAISEEWQSAVEELKREVTLEGMPWSCAGGALGIVLDEGGRRATLRFRNRAGREAIRHVPSSRELASTAEALLATTAPAPPPAARERATTAPGALDSRVKPAVDPAPRAPQHEPRFLATAMGGVRFSGPTRALWFAPELRATIPVDAWSVGIWFRYALPYTLVPVPKEFSMSQANLGFAAGRRLLSSPIEARLTVDPSIAVVSMEGDVGEDEASGTMIDFQIGLGLSAALPITSTWRAVVRLDGELSPSGLGAERRIDPVLPPLPVFQLGASIGVEAVVR